MTFQPVNSLLSWFIATEWKQFSTIYALCFTGVCVAKPPLLNTLPTEADVHGAQKVLSNNGFRMANCFCCLTKCHGVPCSLPSKITTVLKNCKTFSPTPKCSRPRLRDPRPRLSFLYSRRLKDSRTTSLELGNGAWAQKNKMIGLPGPKSLLIS